MVPFILFYFMDSIGTREIAAELQPQVAALYELDTNETLDKQLHAIWRTPKTIVSASSLQVMLAEPIF